ncbi:quinone oxidoreductase family protein [Pseudonocardia xishanensis]|uniref:Zinc-binding dehydrogenase n=1 Tax=Pseudonocardia xishanensis TaxID=630995 RepID=A0ABP8S1R1_9PSEU
MRAAAVTTCGEPPVLVDRGDAAPGSDEVLIEVVTAPITPLDLLCASGTSYFGRPATPYVPGVQGVGRHENRLVWFPTTAGMRPGDGSMAERAVARRDELVALPEGVDPVLMAATGLSAVAAFGALHRTGGLQAGESVIVLGGGGVVGQAAIQLARAAGAGRVVAGARSGAAQERAREVGADVVVELDDDLDGMTARFRAAGPADLVVDPLYGVPAAAAAGALRPEGRLVNLGGSAGETSPLDSSTIRSRSLRILGYTNNALTADQRRAAIGEVAEAVRRGALTVAHESVPLDDVTAAWQRQAAGCAGGRIVLRP